MTLLGETTRRPNVPTRPGARPAAGDDSGTPAGITREIARLERLLGYASSYPNTLPRPGFTAEQVQSGIIAGGTAKLDDARMRLSSLSA